MSKKDKERRKEYNKEWLTKNPNYNYNYKQRPEVKKRIKEYTKKYRQENKEKIKAERDTPENKAKLKLYMEKWYQENKEHMKAYRNQPENKERQKEYSQRPEEKERRKKHFQRLEVKQRKKEYMEEYNKEYYQRPEVKERINKNHRSRIKNDPNFRIIGNLRNALLFALKNYSTTGKVMSSKKYGIDYKKIIEHLRPFPKDIENYEVDHIIPLSKFDLNNPEQVRIVCAPENHAWLLKEANRIKGNRLVHPDYYKKYGYNPKVVLQ